MKVAARRLQALSGENGAEAALEANLRRKESFWLKVKAGLLSLQQQKWAFLNLCCLLCF
jgi:hypothetical protein